MGVFWTGLAWFLGTSILPMIFRVIFGLGIGFATMKGMTNMLEPYVSGIYSNINLLNNYGEYAWFAVLALKIPEAIALLIGVYSFVLTLKILTVFIPVKGTK
ncbi:MAG: hypothetical protein NPINA01_33480 [Nitrospinaceae bacterium]|nr:MAG: hypothetical protein NPINA01_33480 [Nitrospinaceae bacterium]